MPDAFAFLHDGHPKNIASFAYGFNKWLSLSLSHSGPSQGSLACLVRSTRRSIPQSMKLDSYRFTHWNAFRAFFRPGFLRSTTLASRVNKPAAFSAGL